MTIFEGLALAAWKKMWSLYDQRYGTFGEARVAALQRDIEKMQRALDEAKADADRWMDRATKLESDLAGKAHDVMVLKLRAKDAESRANGLAARVNELEAKVNGGEVPASPYTVPSDGATVGAMVPDSEVSP